MKGKEVSIVDVSWGEKEIMDTIHRKNRITVLLNQNHCLLRELGWRLHCLKKGEFAQKLLKDILCLLDLLFMGYAKTEAMYPAPQQKYSFLRSSWGAITAKYLGDLSKLLDGTEQNA